MDLQYPARERRMRRPRLPVAFTSAMRLAAALLLVGAGASHAQLASDPLLLRGSANVPVYAEYDKKVRASEQLSPLGGQMFGEEVSLYTGATQFSQVDIDLPGNDALPVQLRRRFVVAALVHCCPE